LARLRARSPVPAGGRHEPRPTTHTNRQAVAVIGAGYVGLPRARTLAHFGHHVVRPSAEQSKLRPWRRRAACDCGGRPESWWPRRSRGQSPFHPTRRSTRWPALRLCSCACRHPRAPTARPTLSYVESAGEEEIARRSVGGPERSLSTSRPLPVGSANMVEQVIGRPIHQRRLHPDSCGRARRCSTASKPGPDRGGRGRRAGGGQGRRAVSSSTRAPLIVTDATTSETIKYASNAFRHQAQFCNALAGLCRGGGSRRPRRAARPRLRQAASGSSSPPRAGMGWLVPPQGHQGAAAHRERGRLRLLTAGREPSPPTTSSCRGWRPKSRRPAAVSADGATIAVWGLTFKANTTTAATHRACRSPIAWPTWEATVQAFRPHGRRRDRRPRPA